MLVLYFAVTKGAIFMQVTQHKQYFNALLAKHLLVLLYCIFVCVRSFIYHFPLDLESEPTRSKYQSTVEPDTLELLSLR